MYSSLFIHHLYKSIKHDEPCVLILVVRTVVDKYIYMYTTGGSVNRVFHKLSSILAHIFMVFL
jgi:hypothetical protein